MLSHERANGYILSSESIRKDEQCKHFAFGKEFDKVTLRYRRKKNTQACYLVVVGTFIIKKMI